jgi:hypothetical protein
MAKRDDLEIRMKRAVVLRIEDSNFAGYGWTWEFSVTRRKDGSFSVTAKQETVEGPAMRIPPGDKENVVVKIEKVDRRIGREIRSSMQNF